MLRFRDLSITAVSITVVFSFCNYTEHTVLKLYFINLNHLFDCCNNSEFRDSAGLIHICVLKLMQVFNECLNSVDDELRFHIHGTNIF